jgi:hypothetical protein
VDEFLAEVIEPIRQRYARELAGEDDGDVRV